MPDYSLLAECLKLKNNYSQADITGSAKSVSKYEVSKPSSLDKCLTQKQNSQIQLYGGIKDLDIFDTFKLMRKFELCK